MRERGWKEGAAEVVRKHRPDYLIALYTALLMLIGLVVIYAIGPQRANVLNNAIGSNYSDSYFFIKQTISLALAVVAFCIMAVFPFRLVTKHATAVLVAGLVACAILFIASKAGLSIAEQVNGASRYCDGYFAAIYCRYSKRPWVRDCPDFNRCDDVICRWAE